VKLKFSEVIDDIWARLTFEDDSVIEVSRRQIGPLSIGEALEFANDMGLDLPSPELIDLIWNAADLKIKPRPRSFVHWTAAEMNDPKVYAEQVANVEKAIAGQEFTLLAGEFKDVVRGANGKIGLYGWHQLNGKVLQPYFTGHAMSWKDYSQGLRLTKRIG
jgi:hypothetical protein